MATKQFLSPNSVFSVSALPNIQFSLNFVYAFFIMTALILCEKEKKSWYVVGSNWGVEPKGLKVTDSSKDIFIPIYYERQRSQKLPAHNFNISLAIIGLLDRLVFRWPLLSVNVSVCLSVRRSVRPSVRPSVCVSFWGQHIMWKATTDFDQTWLLLLFNYLVARFTLVTLHA